MKSRRACESLLFLSGGIGHDRAAVGLGPGGVGGHVGVILECGVDHMALVGVHGLQGHILPVFDHLAGLRIVPYWRI